MLQSHACCRRGTQSGFNAAELEQLATEGQKQRYTPEDPDTLEQIKNLNHGCCIVMLR